MSLVTNLKDAILNTTVNSHRRYNVKSTSNDSVVLADVYLQDITDYAQTGDELPAQYINETNTAVNNLTEDVTSIRVLTSGSLPSTGVEGRLYFTTF